MNKIRFDKIRGVLYGVAVGDALGAPLEFMSAQEIRRQHGHVNHMIGGGWLGVAPGEVTDDTQMTLCVARGIVEQPGDPIAAIGEEFVNWSLSGPKDIGGTCASSINRAMRNGRRPTAVQWLQASKDTDAMLNGRSGGNGSLMRTAFVGCWYKNELDLTKWATGISQMTHWDREAAEICTIYSSIIARTINRKQVEMRFDTFKFDIAKTKYARALQRDFIPNPTGYVVDSFEAAIWSIMQHPYSFEGAVETAVNLGGDADTIGAITGGLAGALYGYKHIPDRWKMSLAEHVKSELDTLSMSAEEHHTA